MPGFLWENRVPLEEWWRCIPVIARKIAKDTGWDFERILKELDVPGVYWEYDTVHGKTSKNIILREDLIKAEPVDSFYSIAARAGDFKSKYIEVLTHEWYHKLISEGKLKIPSRFITRARDILDPNAKKSKVLEMAEELYVDHLMRITFGGRI